MPTYAVGNLWNAFTRTNLLCVTTNALVVRGRLVMGAGAAREARERLPGLDPLLGEELVRRRLTGCVYGLVTIDYAAA